jgi:hypothetical protein
MKKNLNQKASTKDFHSYPWWSPRFWHGMPMRVWFDLVRQNHWKIAPSRLGLLGTISAASCFNSTAESLCKARFRRQLASPPDTGPPLFIIGHWRSGTTLLHEILMLDDRFCCPSTYQCFAPGHFLLTEAFLTTALAWIMPAKRPMDNVAAGWHRPQEDEFALVNMGAASPYRRMAFPNTMPSEPTALDLESLTAKELAQWKDLLRKFIAMLAIRDARRPILKSPTHTARMAVLASMFPGARFLHIVRDPFVVFPSTKRLWNSLHHVQSMQIDSEENAEEYVFQCFDTMYSAFERDRAQLNPGQLHEIHYEELVANPVSSMEKAYEKLDLGGFDKVRPAFEEQAESMKGYTTNTYQHDARIVSEISQRWQPFIQRYGYKQPPVS